MMECILIILVLVFLSYINCFNNLSHQKIKKFVRIYNILNEYNDDRGEIINQSEIDEAYQRALQRDSEWLSDIFEDDLIRTSSSSSPISSLSSLKEKSDDNDDDLYSYNPPSVASPSCPSKLDNISKLGYSTAEWEELRDPVKQILLKNNVRRPKKGIPLDWMIRNNHRDAGENVDKQQNYSNGNVKRREEDLNVKQETLRNDENDVGSSYQWSSTPRPPSRFETSVGVKTSDFDSSSISSSYKSSTNDARNKYEAYRRGKYTSAPVGRKTLRHEEDALDWENNENEENEDKEHMHVSGFWPDVYEFRDMLVEEARWRVEVVGPMAPVVSPLVRSETKWRYNLYRSFLDFLDLGITDSGFETIPESFSDGDGDYNY